VPNLRRLGKYCSLRWRVLTRAIETNGSFGARQLRISRDMESMSASTHTRSSIEALKLRRMRVRDEISLSKEGGAGRAEDLEALREEFSSLSKEIEHAED
jgi:hypothetical protein